MWHGITIGHAHGYTGIDLHYAKGAIFKNCALALIDLPAPVCVSMPDYLHLSHTYPLIKWKKY
ncbi:Uncharacterised protein [Legionella cherrii]|uniref:Uncharacterized protein n=1 Tax=Legionella cherrii TaxID=28084 RepID=A0ABY6T6W1_9GAMM|nr:Uncharacterised protein [Legionella cherrii]